MSNGNVLFGSYPVVRTGTGFDLSGIWTNPERMASVISGMVAIVRDCEHEHTPRLRAGFLVATSPEAGKFGKDIAAARSLGFIGLKEGLSLPSTPLGNLCRSSEEGIVVVKDVISKSEEIAEVLAGLGLGERVLGVVGVIDGRDLTDRPDLGTPVQGFRDLYA